MDYGASGKSYINELIEYIEKNISVDVDTGLLSKLGFVSLRQLYRDFYSCTGYSVKEYVRKRRLSKALALIKASELPLAEVAYECGYSSQQALCAAVKNAIDMTPTEYRESRDYYLFTRPGDGLPATGMPNRVDVSAETIPQAVCLKYYRPYPEGIENNAVSRLLSALPGYSGRLFGRNGERDEKGFCYELWVQGTGDVRIPHMQRHSINESFRATFAIVTVPNDANQISRAWDYLYTDWLSFSMFEYTQEHYFEEYLLKDGIPARLRLYLPVRKRGGHIRITIERMPSMRFFVSAAAGDNAEQTAAETVFAYLVVNMPDAVHALKMYYTQKGRERCICGIKVDSDIPYIEDETARELHTGEGLYAVLHSSVAGDYSQYRNILLSWMHDNGLPWRQESIFAVYDAERGYDRPVVRMYCPLNLA